MSRAATLCTLIVVVGGCHWVYPFETAAGAGDAASDGAGLPEVGAFDGRASEDRLRDLSAGEGACVISGTVRLALTSGTCTATNPAADCKGRLFVGAYTKQIPPFGCDAMGLNCGSGLLASWVSPGVVDLSNLSAKVQFVLPAIKVPATIYLWSFLAESQATYKASNPSLNDPVNGGTSLATGPGTTSVVVTETLTTRWFGL